MKIFVVLKTIQKTKNNLNVSSVQLEQFAMVSYVCWTDTGEHEAQTIISIYYSVPEDTVAQHNQLLASALILVTQVAKVLCVEVVTRDICKAI